MEYKRRKGKMFPTTGTVEARRAELEEHVGYDVEVQSYTSVGRQMIEYRLGFNFRPGAHVKATITRESGSSSCNFKLSLEFLEQTTEGKIYLPREKPTAIEKALEKDLERKIYHAFLKTAILDGTFELPF